MKRKKRWKYLELQSSAYKLTEPKRIKRFLAAQKYKLKKELMQSKQEN